MNHSHFLRVYYEDTDAGGFVYYANYLKYAERGRTELLRSAGLENKKLMDEDGLAFVVRHINADYHKPAFLDDQLEVTTRIVNLKNASVKMNQQIFRNDRKKENLLFSADVTLACIDTNTQKPVRFPDAIKSFFQTHLTSE